MTSPIRRGGRFSRIAPRWRVWSLMGLVLVAALTIKAMLIARSSYLAWELRRSIAQPGFSPQTGIAESTLVAALADPDLRAAAAWALVRRGSTAPALGPALIEMLEAETGQAGHDYRRYLRQDGEANALKRLKLPAAFLARRLRAATESEDRWIRTQAYNILCDAAGRAQPSEPTLVPLLLAALRDEDRVIGTMVAEALAKLDGDARRRAVAILLEPLRGADLAAMLPAAIHLARFNPEAEPAVSILLGRLETGDVASRLGTLVLLGRLGPMARPAVPAVVRAMTSPDAAQNAYFFLQPFRAKHDLWDNGPIHQSLAQAESATTLSSQGALLLGRIGTEAERDAIDLLIGMLRDADDAEKLRAAEALGALGPKASATIPTLLALAERKMTVPPVNYRSSLSRRLYVLTQVCNGDDPQLVALLCRMLEFGDATERHEAANNLAYRDPPVLVAVPLLLKGLKDSVQSVRFSAAIALGRYEGPGREAAVSALIDALRDEDDEGVRTHVAKSLARLRAGADWAIPAATHLLRARNPSYRMMAAEILGAFGPESATAIPDLIMARTDRASFVRDAVEKALQSIESPDEAEPRK